MKLNTIQKIVHQILTNHPETRVDDKLLYYRLLQKISPNTLHMAVGSYLVEGRTNVPSIESVGRCRRKVQELHPELRANEQAARYRVEKEMEYREYAHGRG